MLMLVAKDVFVSFGQYVRQRRARIGLLQKDVADAIDRPTSYVSRLENDQFKDLPSPEEMRRLAEVLECTEADLLRAAGYIPESNEEQRTDRATVYTFVQNDPNLSDFQKHIIFEALEYSERRRREIEAAEKDRGSGV